MFLPEMHATWNVNKQLREKKFYHKYFTVLFKYVFSILLVWIIFFFLLERKSGLYNELVEESKMWISYLLLKS